MGANRDRHEGIDSLGKRKVTGVVLELLRETVVPGTRAILAPLDEHRFLMPRFSD